MGGTAAPQHRTLDWSPALHAVLIRTLQGLVVGTLGAVDIVLSAGQLSAALLHLQHAALLRCHLATDVADDLRALARERERNVSISARARFTSGWFGAQLRRQLRERRFGRARSCFKTLDRRVVLRLRAAKLRGKAGQAGILYIDVSSVATMPPLLELRILVARPASSSARNELSCSSNQLEDSRAGSVLRLSVTCGRRRRTCRRTRGC